MFGRHMTGRVVAALLIVAVVAPYSHRAWCAAQDHDDMIMTHEIAWSDGSVDHGTGASCHDGAECGIMPVAPVLESSLPIPTSATVDGDKRQSEQSLSGRASSPLTPPPQA
jgi:hypothetical protein